MPGVARVSQDNVAGGTLLDGATNVYIDNQLAAVLGTHVAPHGSHSGTITITQGSSTVFADGKPIARLGDPASCGDSISTASSDVIAG
jgi:uncharacterized Zn-binding protein involved in type VI secretion